MAATTFKGGSRKKRTSNARTRFYIVRTLREVRTDLSGKLDAYNRRYITQPLKAGKTIVEDLRAEPRKTVAHLMDDGKARIADLNKGAKSKIDGYANDGRAFLTKTGKNPREAFNTLVDDGKTHIQAIRSSTRDKLKALNTEVQGVIRGVEKDTQMVISDVIDGSKKAFDQVPGKQRIEKEIASRMEALPATLNLPSRKDIDSLVGRVKQLNAKVDALNKAKAA